MWSMQASYKKSIYLLNHFREKIASISTFFKKNLPFGETNILYKNGTRILLQLNEFGFYCGAQNYYNEDNELIKMKQLTLNTNLEWVKKHDFYFILRKNFKLTNILSTVGNYTNSSILEFSVCVYTVNVLWFDLKIWKHEIQSIYL